MRGNGHRHGTRLAVAGAALGLLALLGACSGGSATDSDGHAETPSGEAMPPASDGLASGEQDAAGLSRQGDQEDVAGTRTGAANRPTVQTRAVIRRGEVSLVTKEMNRARTDIDDLLASLGGYLASEDTVNDRAGRPERSVLVLRVPEPAFDEAMRELAAIGRTERTDRTSKDVTTEVIDIDTRVATQEASLARLQRFLRQATDVDAMIRLESEIATRQAELESLEAQQKYLGDQTSMSTIEVRLRTPAAPPPPEPHDETGFLAGLEDGWHALRTVLVGAATVAGALLPFVVAFALLGVPTWLLLRTAARRRRQDAPLSPPTPEAG